MSATPALRPTNYLEQFDAAPDAAKYPLVRQWMDTEPLPFFKELREKRPVLVTPVCTLVTRYLLLLTAGLIPIGTKSGSASAPRNNSDSAAHSFSASAAVIAIGTPRADSCCDLIDIDSIRESLDASGAPSSL